MEEERYTISHVKSECEFIKGNVTEFEVTECDCEIKADIVVKVVRCVRVWGQVITCEGKPVEEALVKLVKVICKDGKTRLKGIAHTVTDCKGFYQFDICEKEEKALYKIIVSKPAKGKEREICGLGECKPCDCKPCDCV